MSDYTLHLGDCIAGMAGLADKSIDHVIADPPYEAEAHTQGRRIKTKGGGGDYGETGSCILNFQPITDVERQACAEQYVRLARRWIIVFCQVEAVSKWRDALISAGASYRRSCVWIKDDAQPQLSGDRPGMGYEAIVCCHAPGRSRWNGGGKCGVYRSARASTLERRPALHMTEKPMPVMRALVSDFTDPGELVLDSHMGSGTTGLACLELGRRFVGFEQDPKHFATAQERLANAQKQESLFRTAPTEQLKLTGAA